MNANAPLSEQFRLAAKDWVDKDSAASMLEETKSAVLSQRMAALGDMAVSKAELQVKASPEWRVCGGHGSRSHIGQSGESQAGVDQAEVQRVAV